jgi:hypothetical protein
MADAEEESVASDRESEEGGGERSSPALKTKSPKKKKKVTSSGMQIPEHWPWEEAKKLFIKPDVVKGEELEVGVCRVASSLVPMNTPLIQRSSGKRQIQKVSSSSCAETRVSSESSGSTCMIEMELTTARTESGRERLNWPRCSLRNNRDDWMASSQSSRRRAPRQGARRETRGKARTQREERRRRARSDTGMDY